MQAAAQTAAPMADAGAAVPPAAPSPSPNYTPPPPPMPSPSTMAEGGETGSGSGGGIKAFFSDVNVVDVTISAFIVAAVIYSIQYHRYMMMIEKTGYADLSTRVQKLESSIEAAKRKAEANAAGSGKTNMRRKRALMSL
jgi:hypothetical protein